MENFITKTIAIIGLIICLLVYTFTTDTALSIITYIIGLSFYFIISPNSFTRVLEFLSLKVRSTHEVEKSRS
ncbi:hypothetical protein [Aliarcobacter butzleri]|uniref:hypothetical protein n=1 Tax=Aliarcobacter butzleri TaxID=28197 RepID=UPI0021B1C92B|nr:hypothetical protein [Aliarcobacter butzleri]MCT7632140.1 hypothetical protein [Aliarcobacter butzleri]